MIIAITLAVVVALMLAARAWLHRRLAAPRVPVTTTPEALGLVGQAVQIPTARGKWLSAWLLDGDPQRGRVVLCHGWGVNRCALVPLARPLQALGWQVLMFDVRNHGESDSDTFSSMPRFAEDIDAALAWLQARTEDGAGPMVVAGHSVGAAATLLAASRRNDLAGVISLAGFVHPGVMMRRWLAARGIPLMPLGFLILRYVEHVIGYRFEAIAPVNVIRAIRCPVLIAHGRSDRVIPPQDAEALAAAADPNQIELVWLRGGHDLSAELADQWPRLSGFLSRLDPVSQTARSA